MDEYYRRRKEPDSLQRAPYSPKLRRNLKLTCASDENRTEILQSNIFWK